MKWSEEYRINSHDIDENRIVSASALMRYMQDTANLHMAAMRPSYDDLFDAGYSYVLSRFSMSSYAPLYSHETVISQSWACESRGVSHNRCYRIMKDDRIVAEAVSVWALVSIKDRRLVRANELSLDYGTDEMLDLDMPTRFRIPSHVNPVLVGDRLTEYADVDMNRHMNNTHYPDILCGYIPEISGNRVISMTLNFVNEAPLGERIKIYSVRSTWKPNSFLKKFDSGIIPKSPAQSVSLRYRHTYKRRLRRINAEHKEAAAVKTAAAFNFPEIIFLRGNTELRAPPEADFPFSCEGS